LEEMDKIFEHTTADGAMTLNLKTLVSKPFVMIWVSNISSLLPMWLLRMV
jgi:hypothetical protein